MKKTVLLIWILFVITPYFTSCSSGSLSSQKDKALVGKWKAENKRDEIAEFFADGTSRIYFARESKYK